MAERKQPVILFPQKYTEEPPLAKITGSWEVGTHEQAKAFKD
ncbi:MAG: hypothetical protein WBX01_09600 [Nitrososphaeraceae archaeon]